MTLNYVLRKGLLVSAQVALVLLFFFFWQYGADHHAIDQFFFSKPSAIWSYIKLWGSTNQPRAISTGTNLWQDLEATVIVFGLGYLIGTAAGIATGLLVGTVKIVREVLEPFIVFFNAMPRLILLPVLVVVFGFGYLPQVLLVILVIYFLVTIQIATGVAEVPRHLLNNARMLGATRIDLVRSIYIPALMVWVLSTARVVIGYAVQAAVAAEFIGAAKGLGFRFTDAQGRFQAQEMFAAFAIVLLLALVVDILLSVVEKRATRWMPTQGS